MFCNLRLRLSTVFVLSVFTPLAWSQGDATVSIEASASVSKQASYCAVEIGSRGVKGRLFNFATRVVDKELPPFEISYSRDINTNILTSMEGDKFSRRGIDEAVGAVEQMLTEMRTKQPGCRAVVVGSSGIGKTPNRADLVNAVATRTQVMDMEYITADQEARFGFMGTVPSADWDNALFLDIGGGNSKISFLKGKQFVTYDIPFGSVSLTKRAAAGGADFWLATNAVLDAEVRPEFRRIASESPKMLNHKMLFFIGGTAWATATFVNPDRVKRRFVSMSSTELADFRRALQEKTWTEAKPSLFTTSSTKKVFAEESKKVQDIFSRDNLIAGHAVLKMILDDRSRDSPVIFARHGNWIFGYVQEKFSEDAWGKDSIEAHL